MPSRPLPKVEGSKVFELGVKSVKTTGQISAITITVTAKKAHELINKHLFYMILDFYVIWSCWIFLSFHNASKTI